MNKDRPGAAPSPDDPQAGEAAGGGGGQESTPTGKSKFDRVAYMRRYMREYRTRERLKKAEKNDG